MFLVVAVELAWNGVQVNGSVACRASWKASHSGIFARLVRFVWIISWKPARCVRVQIGFAHDELEKAMFCVIPVDHIWSRQIWIH